MAFSLPVCFIILKVDEVPEDTLTEVFGLQQMAVDSNKQCVGILTYRRLLLCYLSYKVKCQFVEGVAPESWYSHPVRQFCSSFVGIADEKDSLRIHLPYVG